MNPLLEISGTSHCEFQKRASGKHTLLLQSILDAIMKSVHILQNSITRIQVVAVLEFVLEGIIRRLTDHVREHAFRHRNVNACPDVVRNHRVIAVLRGVEYTLLLGLVLTRTHDTPTQGLRVVAALNDCVVLHTLLFDILHDTACVHGNVNDLRINLARSRRLERTRNTIANLCKTCEIRRKFLGLVFAGHLLARIHEIRTGGARDVERALPCLLAKHGVLRRPRFHTKQKVNGILVGRLPLVDTRPCVSPTLTRGSQWRVARCEDQAIRGILKLGFKNPCDGSLHCGSVTCEKEFCFDLGCIAARRHKLRAKVFHEELGMTETGGIERIRVATEKRKTAGVLALVAVDIEDAELVEVGKILTINHRSNVVIMKSHDSRPGDLQSVCDFEKSFVTSHLQHGTLSIRLVGNRVILEDVTGTLGTQMTTFHRHDVYEVNARTVPLLAIASLITRRQNLLGSLLGCHECTNVSRQRFNKFLGGHIATEKLNLQFLGGWILQNIRNTLGRLLAIPGLDRRQIKLPVTLHRTPRLAVEDAEVCRRIARSPTKVLAKCLLVTKREANKLIGNIQRILTRSRVLEVATLLLESQR